MDRENVPTTHPVECHECGNPLQITSFETRWDGLSRALYACPDHTGYLEERSCVWNPDGKELDPVVYGG